MLFMYRPDVSATHSKAPCAVGTQH